MKTKEFIKKVEELGYGVEIKQGYVYIKPIKGKSYGYQHIASVPQMIPYCISTDYKWEDDMLFNLINEYARTPLEEEKTPDEKDPTTNYRFEVFQEVDIKAKSQEDAEEKLGIMFSNFFYEYLGEVDKNGDAKIN